MLGKYFKKIYRQEKKWVEWKREQFFCWLGYY